MCLEKDLTICSSIFVARKYDAAKEERFQQEAKQKELQRIEGALQTAARRGETGCSLLPRPFLDSFSVFSTSAFLFPVYSVLRSPAVFVTLSHLSE